MKMKLIVTTYPFDEINSSFEELKKMGFKILFNEYKRKMNPTEVKSLMKKENPDIIIAGTENYDINLLDVCTNLKMISRVGIGMDSVDLNECKNRNIIVTNTPDGPTNAVSELTIAQMINCIRRIPDINNQLKKGSWDRFIGRDIQNSTIGIIGCGRIGNSVIKKLNGFDTKIKIYDINKWISAQVSCDIANCDISSKQEILETCDIISLHIPLTDETLNYIDETEFKIMKKDCVLINTSRGGIVNENNLYKWLYNNKLASAAVDVFEEEPYKGKLKKLTNIVLTPHLGSCTVQGRVDMENESIKNVIKFI